MFFACPTPWVIKKKKPPKICTQFIPKLKVNTHNYILPFVFIIIFLLP